MLPSTTTTMVSHRPSLSTMPRAPRAQLMGAMFAPAQIHICCGPVESLWASGMGSMRWRSDRSSPVVAMMAPCVPRCGCGSVVGADDAVAAGAILRRRRDQVKRVAWEGLPRAAQPVGRVRRARTEAAVDVVHQGCGRD